MHAVAVGRDGSNAMGNRRVGPRINWSRYGESSARGHQPVTTVAVSEAAGGLWGFPDDALPSSIPDFMRESKDFGIQIQETTLRHLPSAM